MKEIDTSGLCCCKNWTFELTTGSRSGSNSSYRFYSCDPVMFKVNNTVVSLTLNSKDIARINLAYFLENFNILPYRYVQNRNGNDKTRYKMFEYLGDYWVENTYNKSQFGIFNAKQFEAFFKEVEYYQLCKCINETYCESDNGKAITYHKGDVLPFMMDKFNKVKIGSKFSVSTWDFHIFIQYFTLEDKKMEEKEYSTYLEEFAGPFINWEINPSELFDNNIVSEYFKGLKEIPEELIQCLKENKLLAGTDPDGGVIGEKGEDGTESLIDEYSNSMNKEIAEEIDKMWNGDVIKIHENNLR